MAEGNGERGPTGAGAALPRAEVPEGGVGDAELLELLRVFEECGLTGSEARCLLAVLRLGRGTAAQVSHLAPLPRTATYPALGALRSRGLVQALPGAVAVFTTPGREEVVARVMAAQEERHRSLAARIEHARQLLARLGPETAPPAPPFVQLVPPGAPVSDAYERLVAEARTELLVMNRPPYRSLEVSPTVLDALGRGVRARALYPAADLAEVAGLATAAGALEAAGVQTRVADRCPVKLAIADASVALISLPDPALPETSFPLAIQVAHREFVELQVGAFERAWERALPLMRPDTGGGARLTAPGDLPTVQRPAE